MTAIIIPIGSSTSSPGLTRRLPTSSITRPDARPTTRTIRLNGIRRISHHAMASHGRFILHYATTACFFSSSKAFKLAHHQLLGEAEWWFVGGVRRGGPPSGPGKRLGQPGLRQPLSLAR